MIKYTISTGTAIIAALVVAGCGHHGWGARGGLTHNGAAEQAAPTHEDRGGDPDAAGDRYMPKITIDGQALSFPPRTKTYSGSCDRDSGQVIFHWAGNTPNANAYEDSVVHVEFLTKSADGSLGIEQIIIQTDAAKAEAAGSPGPDDGFYSAAADIRHFGSAPVTIQNTVVTQTPDGFSGRFDANWDEGDGNWHPVTINLVCDPH